MDQSHADKDSLDNKDTVDGQADEDHNCVSEQAKDKITLALEEEKSEETDNSEKLVISLSSPGQKCDSPQSAVPSDGEDKNKDSEKLVDQNQNSSILCDKEAKNAANDKPKLDRSEVMEVKHKDNPKNTENGNADVTDAESKTKANDESKEISTSASEVYMDVDENSRDTSTKGSVKDDETESQSDISQINNSQLDNSQLDESQTDGSLLIDEDDGNESDSLETLMKDIHKYTANLDMELLTRPFKDGWKREVVQRNVFQKYSDTGKRKSKPVDIYYFTPEGKKLRSMIQITEYVNKSASNRLPLECFCFMRKPIYREPFEIVRSAGKSRRPADTYSKSPLTPKRGRAKGNRMSPKVSSLKPGRPRASGPEPEVVIERDDEEDFFVAPYLEMAVESSKKRSLDVTTGSGLEPPVKKKATARKSTTPRPQQVIKQTNPTMDGRSDGQLCTINCPGLEGQPPQLQCCICMCLFHPRCVNVPDNNIPSVFNCLRCKSGHGKTGNGVEKSSNSYLSIPTAPGSSSTVTVVFPSRSLATSNGGVSPTVPTTPSSSYTLANSINSTLRTFLDAKSPPPLKPALNFEIPPLPPLKPANNPIPRSIHSLTSPTSITIAPPRLTAAPGTVQMRPTLPPPPLTMPPNSQLGLSPQTPVVVQKPSKETPVNAQLLTLPGAVTKRLNLSQPLALKINNVHIVVPPNCVINSKEGLKVVLPPNTFGLPVDPNAKLNVTVSNNSGGMETFKSVAETNNTSSDTGSNKTISDSANTVNSVFKVKKTRIGINPTSCYMKMLYGGYECMLHIFKYLTTYDLLRVGQVCKTWHHISKQSSLWRLVRLKDMKIPDWETSTRFIRQVGVERLSLKGLHHYDDRNRTWHMLMANLHNLVALRDIQFGLVPATVLHSVCEKLQSLEVFSAEFISDSNSEQMWNTPTKIDIGKFSTLQHLRELRLRGVGGLVLPTFSSTSGLSQLTQLSHLQVLSLTTLRSFQDSEFHFLGQMQKLKTLEIGDCSPWSETYEHLAKLTNLKRLRLECGGDLKNTSLADALIQITGLEELELVMFIIPDNLSSITEKLENLYRFIVWPDTSEDNDNEVVKSPAKVNTNTLNSLSQLKKLEYLEWGILNNTESCSNTSNTDNKVEIKFTPGQFDSETITIHQLTEKLCKIMPDTEKIRVFKTQPLSHTKYKNRES
ncbi:uncharacterized protein LOC126820299 [Patella vulgata]|uniref:uncharacterized protein LOC126820299 n=1 Tax=Patella vulgata TaxID=6465 RepID=UPI0024A7BA2B|nr:uncharacterized protein LOC126820299 [Patella vulgata]XP_050404108.2 uncharacterized protein LOC126820299 [Patella vulgata]